MTESVNAAPLSGENLMRALREEGDFVRLSREDYAAYTQVFHRVCWVLRKWCEAAVGAPYFRATTPLIERLARSIELLVFRHAHSVVNDLSFDLRESGFPHMLSMVELAGDLQAAPKAVAVGDDRRLIKEHVLHEIFGNRRYPLEVISSFARRIFNRRIQEQPIFLPFTFGELKEREDPLNGRSAYSVTWGCYDHATNLPALHYMEFEWSSNRPLAPGRHDFDLLVETLRTIGSHNPKIGRLALELDVALEQVHPKLVTRVKIGPLRTGRFSLESRPVIEALRRFGQPNDFALDVLIEGVLSESEYTAEPVGFRQRLVGGQVLQKFAIDFRDPVQSEALASFVSPMLVLPHTLRQALGEEPEALKGYPPGNLVTYDRSHVYAE